MIVKRFQKDLTYIQDLFYWNGNLAVGEPYTWGKSQFIIRDPFSSQEVVGHTFSTDIFDKQSSLNPPLWSTVTTRGAVVCHISGTNLWPWDGSGFTSWHIGDEGGVAIPIATTNHAIVMGGSQSSWLVDRAFQKVCDLPHNIRSFALGRDCGAAIMKRKNTGVVFRFDGSYVSYELPFTCSRCTVSEDDLVVTFASHTTAVTFDLD